MSADAAAAPRDGFKPAFGDDKGARGRGPRRARGGRDRKDEWIPTTKLGRLVKDRKIKSLEDIFLFSLPIKEYQIVDFFLGDKLKDEMMHLTPVQRASSAGQQTRFKAWVLVGDSNGHLGLGVRCAKEAAGSIRGAIVDAKLNIIPVRRGFWGARGGAAHTVPFKVSGKCGSVMCRIIPAPRGTGLVAAEAIKKVLSMAGVSDAYTASAGKTRTMGNFIFAAFYALRKTYTFLAPEFWKSVELTPTPYQEFSEHLKATKAKKL
jgi:small subunit ribosomal protein S2e